MNISLFIIWVKICKFDKSDIQLKKLVLFKILDCNVYFVYCICILYILWYFIQVCVQWCLFCLFVFFLFVFFNYLVTWTGNFSLLAWLAISVCCKISEVRRFFRQPAAWHVSLFGTTGYFVCRGNKCILFNVHNYSRNCICRQYDTEMSRTLCQKADTLNSWLLCCILGVWLGEKSFIFSRSMFSSGKWRGWTQL